MGINIRSILYRSVDANAADAGQGKEMYLQYCSSCHGQDGKGSGSVSEFLKVKVPDLTLLKKNNKGIYPARSGHISD